MRWITVVSMVLMTVAVGCSSGSATPAECEEATSGDPSALDNRLKAVETLDRSLGALVAAVKRQGGAMLVTADHGNCEMMYDPETHGPHTAHTLNRVPMFLVGGPTDVKGLHDGKLADVAPTLLALMHMQPPAVMDGQSLLSYS